MSKTISNSKKRKTRSDKFPLTLHPTGQYCKKIKGKLYYFGANKREAMQRYLENAVFRKIPGKCTPPKNRRDRNSICQATFIIFAVSSLRSASASAFSFFHSPGRSSSILSAGWILTLLRTSLKYLNGSIPFSLQLATRL